MARKLDNENRITFRSNFITDVELQEVLKSEKQPQAVQTAVRKNRTITCLKKVFPFIAWFLFTIICVLICVLSGITILWIIAIITGLIALKYFDTALEALRERFARIPFQDPKKILFFYYSQLIASIPDWGLVYSCLTPYTKTRISLSNFIEKWEGKPNSPFQEKFGVLPIAHVLEKDLVYALPKKEARCATCESQAEVYPLRNCLVTSTANYKPRNILQRAKYDYIECPKCGSQQCKRCFDEKKSTVCFKCATELESLRPHFLLHERPQILAWSEPSDIDRAAELIAVNKAETENLATSLYTRLFKYLYFVPLSKYTEEEMKDINQYIDTLGVSKVKVCFENVLARIGSDWFVVQPDIGEAIITHKEKDNGSD